ncbi:MAG: 1-acyl-sn-glycerol-3-phosphate acyltransferase, partial [Deltaproteobacteria bacterium]|nr:1-acyl-sn-glycerol-3-phosphate acyltransferase [Deltaproteobacteria bacterium]
MKVSGSLRRLLLLPYQIFVIITFFLLMLFGGMASCLASLADASGNKAHRWLIYWAKTNLALAGLRVEIEGLERLDPAETYIFMPNHASFLDILLAFAYIPHNFRIITKKEIFRIPLMGWALRRSRQIPMDRANPRKGLASLKQAFNLLREGISIVVFPEGTRTGDGGIKDLKATVFILPIRSGVSVVPVRIDGTFAALKR